MATEYASEIHRLLKLGDHTILPHINGASEDLPVLDVVEYDSHAHVFEHEAVSQPGDSAVLENNFINSLNVIGQTAIRFKGLLIYPAIFIIAFAFFFIVLNFSSIVAQFQGLLTKPQAQVILGDQLSSYQEWINGYYYAVADRKLLDPNNDIDKDGLSNQDEFIMRTNPTLADSDGDGFYDGIEVINSYNPWGRGSLTSAQQELAGRLDMIMINNRISYNVSQDQGGVVAGVNTSNYDLSKPGRLSIPKLDLTVPLIWSADPSDFETDLTKGVIHYPGTALPGGQGTIYVSGHSSDYVWKKDPMQTVFARLSYLKPGDDVFVDVYGIDGKVYNYRYQVTGQKIYAPDDQAQFIDNSANKLNLSTCWPIGTQKDRLVVSAIEKPL